MNGFFTSEVRLATAGAAEAHLRETYGDLRVNGLGGFSESAAGDSAFFVARVGFDGRFEIRSDADRITLAFSTPGYGWRVGRDEGVLDAGPALFRPGARSTGRIDRRVTVTLVSFDVPRLTELAGWIYGEDVELRFTGPRAVTSAAGRHVERLTAFVHDARALSDDLVRASAYHALALAVLEGFPLVGDRARRTRSAEARLGAYRRAGRFIDDNLSLPITGADIAHAAGVPERELHTVFRAHSPTGSSARDRLTSGRIAAAHRDLVEGDPTLGDSVRRIAARWGFPHPGRFAAAYRRQYGVDPKYVLDR